MKFDTFTKGKKLLYLPEITEKTVPYEVFFMFITEDYYKSGSYAKIVVCKNESSLNICNNIEEFRCKQKEQEDLYFNDDYKFIVDLNTLKEFNDKLKFEYEKLYLFILTKDELYRKLLKKSYLFRKDEPSLFFSPFFSGLKKVYFFY